MAVADTGRHCTHYYVPATGRYLRLTGTKDEKMVSPVGVAFEDDAAGKLWVSDSTGKVFAFRADGMPLLVVRSAGPEALERPTGLAWSPARKWLYVVDTPRGRIHVFDPGGAYVRSFGGRGEADAGFNFPTHIFRSAGGELFLTDALNFRIVVLDEMGSMLGSFGRQGDGSGDLGLPKGLAVDDDGIVYVVDALFDNVQLFKRQGDFLLTVGRRGTDLGEFWLPAGAFIGKGQLYVCDAYNRRVQVFRITQRYEDEAER
jgi:sugar lactone lactonase YvrE